MDHPALVDGRLQDTLLLPESLRSLRSERSNWSSSSGFWSAWLRFNTQIWHILSFKWCSRWKRGSEWAGKVFIDSVSSHEFKYQSWGGSLSYSGVRSIFMVNKLHNSSDSNALNSLKSQASRHARKHTSNSLTIWEGSHKMHLRASELRLTPEQCCDMYISSLLHTWIPPSYIPICPCMYAHMHTHTSHFYKIWYSNTRTFLLVNTASVLYCTWYLFFHWTVSPHPQKRNQHILKRLLVSCQ